jgi:hypothetical protein
MVAGKVTEKGDWFSKCFAQAQQGCGRDQEWRIRTRSRVELACLSARVLGVDWLRVQERWSV